MEVMKYVLTKAEICPEVFGESVYDLFLIMKNKRM